MEIRKSVLRLLPPKVLFRVRSLRPDAGVSEVIQSLSSSSSHGKPVPLLKDSKIVIVGSGVAGVRTLETLAGFGFKNILMISDTQDFGGVCVHQGCMPLEFFWAHQSNVKNFDDAQAEFKTFLSSNIESSILQKAKWREGRVELVQGKYVVLSSDEKIPFDHLIVATGKGPTATTSSIPNCISLPELWKVEQQRVVIVNYGFLEVWSLAAMLVKKRCKVVILNMRSKSFYEVPSFQEFKESLGTSVSEFFDVQRLHNPQGGMTELRFEHEHGVTALEYDFVYSWGNGERSIPPVDGKKILFSDIDSDFRVRQRPDISVAGDASGMLSAAEAELQALLLSQAMTGSSAPNYYRSLPIRIHGQKSWAACGEMWTLFERNEWQKVDFHHLGWSAAHETTGSLWYLFDPKSQRVLAVHIFHELASELITTAQLLLRFSVSDSAWTSSYVHPSASEIFKVVALQCSQNHPTVENQDSSIQQTAIPKLDLRAMKNLETQLGAKLLKSILLSKDSQVALAYSMLSDMSESEIKALTDSPDRFLSSQVFFHDRARGKIMIFRGENCHEIHLI